MAEYLRGTDGDTAELIAEAYVLNVGTYLSGFEDAVFETLGTAITGDEEILDVEQWTWIDQQRHTLG